MDKICVNRQDAMLYIFLLIVIITFFAYNMFCKCKEHMSGVNLTSHLTQQQLTEKIKSLQDSLYNSQLSEQKCSVELDETKRRLNESSSISALNKIYNPLVAPERIYNRQDDYQVIGYVYNSNERYPLFGRHKYPGRSDRWEYYIIDETRNKLKIPFKSKNDNELYTSDDINIPTLAGTYQVQIYDLEQYRYRY